MKHARLLLIICLLAIGVDVQAQIVSSQVITGTELQRRGVYRLGDVGQLFDRSRIASVDGFASTMSVGGLAPVQQRSFRVIIDGHEIETGFWDFQNLTSTGISTTEIDSVRVISHPVIVGGVLASGGVIEVWTKTYESPVAASFSTYVGNESGDPGPFRYSEDDLIVANVDKIGPDASGSLTIQNPDVLFTAGGSISQVIPSDEAVFQRNRKIFNKATTPEVMMVSPFVRFSWKGGNVTSDARVFGSADQDMVFSRAIAREIPVDLKQFQVSWLGTISDTRLGDVRLQTSYRLVDARNLATATRIPLDWNESTLKSSVSLKPAGIPEISELGINTSFGRASSAYSTRPLEGKNSATVFVATEYEISTVDVFASSSVGVYGGRFVGSVLASAIKELRNGSVGVNGSMIRTHRHDADPVGTWLGDGLLASPDIPTTTTSGDTYGLYSADVSWKWQQPASSFAVEVAPSMRYFQDTDLLARTIIPDGEGFVVTANGSQRSDGTIFGSLLSVTHSARVVTSRMFVDVQEVIQGDRYFRNAFNEMPSTKLGFETVAVPAPTFSAFMAATYLTSSVWSDYEMLNDDEASIYSDRVDSAFKIDAGLTKGFWDGKVNVSVLLENILNDHISYHPIGARFDRTMKITAHVQLD